MHTILVTDDNELIRETLQKALVSDGYRVQLATNGEECLETVRNGDVDLILLDMRLPDMNGLDVLSSLRESHPDIIVLMMTAYVMWSPRKGPSTLAPSILSESPSRRRRSPPSSRWPDHRRPATATTMS